MGSNQLSGPFSNPSTPLQMPGPKHPSGSSRAGCRASPVTLSWLYPCSILPALLYPLTACPWAPFCFPQCWLGLLILLGSSPSPLTDTLINHKPPRLPLCLHSAYLQPILSPHKAFYPWPYGPLYSHPPGYTHSLYYRFLLRSAVSCVVSACCSCNFRCQTVISAAPFSDGPHSLQQGRHWGSTHRWSKWSNNLSDAMNLRLCGEYRSPVWLWYIPSPLQPS